MQEQELETYSLKLEGRGISVSRDVGQDVARAILDIVMGGNVRARPGKAAPEPDDVREDRGRPSLSLHEFLENSGAKRNPDKIAVFGQYLMEHEGRREFSRDELRGRFREAGEAVPANFPRDFSWALKNGWIAEDSENRGSYYVTKKGKEAIEQKFPLEIRKKTYQKKGVNRRRTKKGETQLDGKG
ncbi:MAG: hypothetical protein ACRD1R_07910 [Acidobacteriota bacterium]